MLIAEIHGSYIPEARNSEDYLTSAVFGHLRYLPPGAFWEALFDCAVSQPIGQKVLTASEHIRHESRCSLGEFTSLQAIFWPEHKQGIPDLILHFSAKDTRSAIILIEAKLNATKSGIEQHDQLARYLRILDSLSELRPPLPTNATCLAVYLTAVDSRNEVIDSLKEYGDTEVSRKRLYQLRWQDMLRAIDQVQVTSGVDSLVLRDVRAFLHVRDLEYFSGMDGSSVIPTVREADGEFLQEEPLFDIELIPTMIDVIDERWMHAD